MIRFLFTVILLYSFVSSFGQKNILFIGNSYTYYNNMPEILTQIASSAGDSVYTESHTPGGRRISQHAADPIVYQKLHDRTWDYVVLQCQSQEPAFSDNQVAQEVFPYAKQLCDSIRAINPCAIPIFYMTWGRKNGDSRNCAAFPPICTYEGMDSILYSNYLKMGETNDAEVAPVGAVWRHLRSTIPSLELYNSDESHPSNAGSVAAAYTFYSAVFRKDPTFGSYGNGLPKETVDSIKSAVEQVFYQKQQTYNIGVADLSGGFDINNISNCTYAVTVVNPRVDATYRIDFGDGTIDTASYAEHEYQRVGKYIVKVTAEACGKMNYESTQIVVKCAAGIKAPLKQGSIFPNPSKGSFELDHRFSLLSLYDATGKPLSFSETRSNTFEVSNLFKGVAVATLVDRYNEGNHFTVRLLLL